jgi:NRPS condensation-like uncharacterized protein
MWFTCRADSLNAAYNVIFAGRAAPGTVDVPVLMAALAAAVARHSMLRVAFGERDGRPFMRLVDTPPDLEVLDCTRMCTCPSFPPCVCDILLTRGTAADAEFASFIDRECNRPFALMRGPPFRVRVCKRADGSVVLLLMFHHLIMDLWSLVLLMQDLGPLYVVRSCSGSLLLSFSSFCFSLRM